MRKQDFFLKIGLRHFSPLTSEQLHAKNLRDPMVGSMRTFVTGRTDGTDGGYFKGPNGVGPKKPEIRFKPEGLSCLLN